MNLEAFMVPLGLLQMLYLASHTSFCHHYHHLPHIFVLAINKTGMQGLIVDFTHSLCQTLLRVNPFFESALVMANTATALRHSSRPVHPSWFRSTKLVKYQGKW